MSSGTYQRPGPVVRREMTTLVEVLAPVAGRERISAFEVEILWMRHTSADLVWRHGGELLDECGTYCDWPKSRFGSAITNAVEDVPELVQRYAIGPDSTLELAIVASVTDTPGLELAECPRFTRCGKPCTCHYGALPGEWRLPPEIEEHGHRWRVRPAPVVVLEAETVWSSLGDREETDRRLAETVAGWAARWGIETAARAAEE